MDFEPTFFRFFDIFESPNTGIDDATRLALVQDADPLSMKMSILAEGGFRMLSQSPLGVYVDFVLNDPPASAEVRLIKFEDDEVQYYYPVTDNVARNHEDHPKNRDPFHLYSERGRLILVGTTYVEPSGEPADHSVIYFGFGSHSLDTLMLPEMRTEVTHATAPLVDPPEHEPGLEQNPFA